MRFNIRMSKKGLEKITAKDLCYAVISKIRKSFVFDNYSLKSFAGISRFFEHKGFSIKDEQEKMNRIAEIEKITYITINVLVQNVDKISQSNFLDAYKNILICEGPLLGKDIYYADRK